MGELHKPRLAILASGSGSTAEALIHATQTGVVDAEVGLVVANNGDAGVFHRVARMNRQYGLGISTLHISGLTHPEGAGQPGSQTLAESEAICQAVEAGGFSLVALLGYMKKVRGPLLEQYGWRSDTPDTGRMINTHPGPLPQTEGMFGINVQNWVLENNLGYSAQTLHLVAAEYDTGPILNEHRVPVVQGDTPESLFDSVQLTEKAHAPADIDTFLRQIGQ